MPSLSPDEIGRRLAPLFSRPGLRLVVLFGSRAQGHARASSDVDLGVLCEGDSDALLLDVIRLLGTDRVDVVDLRRASPLLAMSAARHGRPLHEGEPAAFASFASLSLRRYNDAARFYRGRERAIRLFLAERGL